MSTLVPHIENSEKKDHEVPAVTENGMVWTSPSMAIFCGSSGNGKDLTLSVLAAESHTAPATTVASSKPYDTHGLE
jgi:hypothetical protein